jgi:hypothetical protein
VKEPRQLIYKLMGDEGCYIFCIVDIAEEVTHERVDASLAYLQGTRKSLIQKNCLVSDAAGFLGMLTGRKWVKRYEGPEYLKKVGEYEVQKWKRKAGVGTIEHFIREGYDPYGGSKTVQEGWLDSKRIFTMV